MTAPLHALSLGAGVQSTTLLLLAAEGRLPMLAAAIFADTGWEPGYVYDHLDRLTAQVAYPAGIPVLRGANGNLRDDALDPEHRFASLPYFLRNPDGSDGMGRRQCTHEYKLVPIKRAVREILGYPHPRPVPKGVHALQWIGISRDEVHREKDSDVAYTRNVFPLLGIGAGEDLVGADGRPGWTRNDCLRYLRSRGWADTPKSACTGCPFHGNRAWRQLRDDHPTEWADAVTFDTQIRAHTAGLRGQPFLHRSRLPLDQAPIDRVTAAEHAAQQTDLFDALADQQLADQELEELEDGAEAGCSPFTCRSTA